MPNALKRLISLRRRSVLSMTLVYLCGNMAQDKFLEQSGGKVNPLRTSCVSASSPFSLFWNVQTSSCHSHVHFSTWNPNRSMVSCSTGPGDFITNVCKCQNVNPKWNPNRSMVTCPMGILGILKSLPYVNPKWNKIPFFRFGNNHVCGSIIIFH